MPVTTQKMVKERCFRCKKLRTDVELRACEDRLCKSCSDYNDACVKEGVFADWQSVAQGLQPVLPGKHKNEDSVPIQMLDTEHASSVIEVEYQSVILNSLLTYVVFSLNNSSYEDIKKSCISFYSAEELRLAKGILWKVGASNVLPAYVRRRDSPSRTEVDAVMYDILDALKALDSADKMPVFATDPLGLHRVPKAIIPAETNPISMCERLLGLESRLSAVEENLSANVCRTAKLEESISITGSYANAIKTSMPSRVHNPPVITVNDKPSAANSSQLNPTLPKMRSGHHSSTDTTQHLACQTPTK